MKNLVFDLEPLNEADAIARTDNFAMNEPIININRAKDDIVIETNKGKTTLTLDQFRAFVSNMGTIADRRGVEVTSLSLRECVKRTGKEDSS